MHNQTPLTLMLALVALLFSWQASAASKQLDAHEHGAATLNLAIDNNVLILEFESPAINIVGFEHAPENDQQTSTIEKATARLKTIGDVFSIPDAAKCNPQSVSVDWVSEKEESHEDHDEHEEHAEHEEHDDHVGQEGHSEFAANYQLICKQVDNLDFIDVKLFEFFPGIEDLDVQGITANGQFATELNAQQNRIELK